MSGVEEQLEQKLSDPDFFKTLGDIGQATLDKVKDGLAGLPVVALHDFLNSEYQLIVADPEVWAQAMEEHGIAPEEIEKNKKVMGYAAMKSSAFNKLFEGKPHIVIFKTSDDLDNLPHTTRHEVAHALDHINAGYDGFVSTNSAFREAYEKYEASEKLDQRLHEQDWSFSRHKKHYEQYAYPTESVAEMMQKYSALCERGYTQVAERIMTNEFPFIWGALKTDMPQIGQSLEKFGLDVNARPLQTTPEDILTQKHIHRGSEGFEIHISVHGLSANETIAVEEALIEKGLHPRNEIGTDQQIYSSLVIPVEEVEKFKAIRKEMIEERQQTSQIDPEHIEDEEYRIAKELFSRIFIGPNVKLTLAWDGALLIEVSNDYDIDELASQIQVPDLSEKDRVKTATPDNQALAIAFNRLPEELRTKLVPNFNRQSGHEELITSEHNPDVINPTSEV